MEAGMQVLGSSDTFNDGAVAGMQAVADKAKPKAKAKAKPQTEAAETSEPVSRDEPIAGAHVGLCVQFCNRDGEIIPGILQRQSKASPGMWDVRIFLNSAATMPPPRSSVPHSETPKPGHWNFIPSD